MKKDGWDKPANSAEFVEIYTVRGCSQLKFDEDRAPERVQAFLSRDEYQHVIRALKKVDFDLNKIDKRKYQLRGLEAYLSVSFNKFMQQKRAEVLQTVMTEQANQKSTA